MKIQEEKDEARKKGGVPRGQKGVFPGDKRGCSQGTKAAKKSSHEVIKKVFPLTGCFRIIPS